MKKILFILVLFVCSGLSAQQYFFNGTVHVPKTTAEINAISSPVEGRQEANSDTGTIYYYNGSDWVDTGKPLVDASGFSGNLNSNITDLQLLAEAVDSLTISGGGASQLSDLSDVNTSTPTNRNVLVADGVDWESRPLVEADISDLGSYLTTDTPQIVTGTKTFASSTNITQFQNSNSSQITLRHLPNSKEVRIGTGSSNVNIFADAGLGFDFRIDNISRYKLNQTGTPTEDVDLITKGYADANYSGGGSSPPFPDNAPIIEDNVDDTKTITIDASNITTGTNRTITMPDADVDLGNMVTTADVDQDINGRKTFTEGIAITKENSATASIQFLDDDGTTSRGLIGYDVFGNSVSISNITSGNDLILFDSGGLRFDGFSGLGNRMLSVDNDGNIGTSALPTDDQTASEVPITDAGNYFTGTDVEGALQELGASTIPFSGIDKTDDFTIADAEIGQIINIVTNDSIVVTYPDDLSIFGFTKFVVKGTGHVCVNLDAMTTTGGSFKTPAGRGESLTVRNYAADEADVLNPNGLEAYVHVDPGPVGPFSSYGSTFIAETTEEDVINTLVDGVGGNDLTASTAAELHLNGIGEKQVRFTGTEYYLSASEDFDFAPGTDEFSFVVKIGDTPPTTGGTIFWKGTTTNGSSYGLAIQDGNNLLVSTSGSSIQTSNRTHQANDVYIVVYTTSGVSVWADGSKVLDNTSIGTTISGENFSVGARANGSSGGAFDLEVLRVYNYALTEGEVTTINTELVE